MDVSVYFYYNGCPYTYVRVESLDGWVDTFIAIKKGIEDMVEDEDEKLHNFMMPKEVLIGAVNQLLTSGLDMLELD